MSTDVKRRGWIQVVRPTGDDPIRERVVELLEMGESMIIVDLKKRTELDSFLLGELAVCQEHARKHDALIRLVLTEAQREQFTATRMGDLLECFLDEEEALDSFTPHDATFGIP
jgi:hypothetical protein